VPFWKEKLQKPKGSTNNHKTNIHHKKQPKRPAFILTRRHHFPPSTTIEHDNEVSYSCHLGPLVDLDRVLVGLDFLAGVYPTNRFQNDHYLYSFSLSSLNLALFTQSRFLDTTDDRQ
jgi:hypothetical protein